MSRWYKPPTAGDEPWGQKRQWAAVSSFDWEWRITPWRGGCWVALRISPNGHPYWERIYPFWIGSTRDLLEVVMDEMLGMLPGGRGKVGSQLVDEGFKKDYPRVWWLLTTDKLPDGSPRKRASISLSMQSDGWAVFLNEKETDHYLCRSGATVEDCLAAIELGLEETPVAWRTNGKPGKRR